MQVKGWAIPRPLHLLNDEQETTGCLGALFRKWNSSGIVIDFGNSSARNCVELWYHSEVAEIPVRPCRRTLANRGFTCDNSAALSLFFAEGV